MKNTSALSTILLASLALTLAGCEVGPDYETPQTELPTTWVSSGGETKAEIDQEWWRNFHDPILNQLISQASDNNFDLQIAEARIAQARSTVSEAIWALLPQGDVKGTATRERNEFAFPSGGGADNLTQLLHKPFNVFQTGFDASWELDLFGGGRRAEEGAAAQLQANEASRDDVRVSLLAEVARTYIEIRSAQAQLATATSVVAADQKTKDIAQQRFKTGQAAGFDALQADEQLQQAQTQIPQLRNQVAQNMFAMDVLLGAQPGATKKMVGDVGSIPASDKQVVLAAPAFVIAQRPDIRVAERKLAAATAQQGVAVAKFFPDVSLNGFYGVLNNSVNTLISPANESFSGAVGVVLPILNYGTLSAQLDNADAQQQEAMATYRKTIVGALSDVERALKAYDEQRQFQALAETDLEKSQHVLKVARERYKEGLTNLLDVLDAERAADAAQNRLVQARAQTSEDIVAIYKSLGGGWDKSAQKPTS